MAEDWTGQWVSEKIRDHDDVLSIEIVESDLIVAKRKGKSSVRIATLSAKGAVTSEYLENAISDKKDVEFIINIPKDCYLTGGAIRFAQSRGIGLGGLGDLMRALRLECVGDYIPPTIEFIERGLRQHDRVSSFERLADLQYRIERTGALPDVLVVFLHEYELVADHIRIARDRYGNFDIVVKTNPNGGLTSSALAVADDLHCKIYKWGEFLGALNRR